MALNLILAPDVLVNASVALKSPPEQVVQRVLGRHSGQTKTTPWILQRVEAMLKAIPEFKDEAIRPQLETIMSHLTIMEEEVEHPPDGWQEALLAAARAAGVTRVVTDHPDLLEKDTIDGVEFVSTEAWLVEQTMPPPAPA